MRGLLFLGAAAVLTAPASAQTNTSCQWIGNVWSCTQNAPAPGINWDLLRSPNQSNSVMESFRQGQEAAQRARQARAERERAEAEAEYYRAQTEAVRARSQPGVAPPQPRPPEPAAMPGWLTAWYHAAQPRMGLYPDFDKVVFAPEVSISEDVVKLMTSSPYAADIAYYLATHRAEAAAISSMPLLEAARAIDALDRKFQAEAEAPPAK
jgi:hypothetical protein